MALRTRLEPVLSSRFATGVVAAMLGLCVVVAWLKPLRSSLWLDETGTAWAARGTLAEVWQRAFHPGQPSIAYAVLTWCAVHVGGFSELTLRMPSLVASVVATTGVYLLARRFCDRHQSLLASALFATHGAVAFAAADARPYAIALMFVVWSALLLNRWAETGKLAYGVAGELLFAVSIAFHYLAATLLLVQLWCLFRQRSSFRLRWRHAAGIGAVLGALLLIFLPHAGQLWRMRADHSFVGAPAAGDVISALLYPRLVIGTLAGLLLARWIWPKLSWHGNPGFLRARGLLLAWFLAPILVLFAISTFSQAGLLVPRYYIWGTPGLAILTASAISGIEPLPARRTMEWVILLALPATTGSRRSRGARRTGLARSTAGRRGRHIARGLHPAAPLRIS